MALAGASLDRSGLASDGIANVAPVPADVGRETPTGGGTDNTRVQENGGVSVEVALVRADISATELICRLARVSCTHACEQLQPTSRGQRRVSRCSLSRV